MNIHTEPLQWFALRAFWNKTQPLIAEADKAGVRTYYAIRTVDNLKSGSLDYKEVPYVPSLFFVQCKLSWLLAFKRSHISDFMIYSDATNRHPAPIRDAEMEMFIMVTQAQNNSNDVEYLGEPKPEYVQGDRVRVTQGLYKGAEGVVRRIKKDRKLLVAITGVAVMAISHIPMCYLEKVQTT